MTRTKKILLLSTGAAGIALGWRLWLKIKNRPRPILLAPLGRQDVNAILDSRRKNGEDI